MQAKSIAECSRNTFFFFFFFFFKYENKNGYFRSDGPSHFGYKTCLKRQLKEDKKVFKTHNPLMQAKSIAECSRNTVNLQAFIGVTLITLASSIPARSHTFVEIDHEIISTVILLPSAESFKKGCCQLQAKVCARSTG